MRGVVLDLDGTLVDSVYLHVVAWGQALAEAGHAIPAWRVHRAIGLSSERLIAHLLGTVPGDDLAEVLTEGHRRRFLDRTGDLRPTRGALDLLEDLRRREVPAVIATSAGTEERKALLEVLGNPDVDTTDAAEVEASKPDPEPLRVAARHLGDADPITMVGDSPWDGYAAKDAGMGFIALRTGGFPDPDLERAGAGLIADDPAGLLGVL